MSRARRFFRRHGNPMKVTGIQAAGGIAVSLLDQQILSSESGKKMLGENSYVKPLIVLVGAHVLKSKAPNLGAGMAGAAGYMLGQTYFAGEKKANVQGIVEAGALRQYPPAFAQGPVDAMPYEAGAVFEVQS